MTVFSAHGVARDIVEEAARRAPAGARRDLPARHQGPMQGRRYAAAAARSS